MNAYEALQDIADFVSEADSFIETFDHEFHGDNDPESESFEGGEEFDPEVDCRFVGATPESFATLDRLIKAATAVVNAEPDELFEGKLDELGNALYGLPRRES